MNPVAGWWNPSRWFGDVPRTVIALGATSFLADISSEMIYPFIPLFLTGVLGAPVGVVGLIEGVAESTASLMKVTAGWWSDRIGRRLPLVYGGYGAAVIGKLLLAFALSWPLVLFARFVDRLGKGVRGSPRDALIADASPEAIRGRSFGLHRSFDTAGAVIGPLLALVLVAVLHDDLRLVFALAVIPGVLSVATLLVVREPRRSRPVETGPPVRRTLSLQRIDSRFRFFLLASLVFALGNSSDVFLILRAQDLGLSATEVVLAYILYNFVYMLSSYPAGIVADRFGKRAVFLAGLLVFATVYTGFAIATQAVWVWPLFAIYGLYIAFTDGVGKALISDVVPSDRRATALGLYGTVTGVAVLIASIAAGQLWERVGPSAPFFVGAVGAVIATVMLATGYSQPRIGVPSPGID